MNYDVEPSEDLRVELQTYVEDVGVYHRRLKERSMQRALNWLDAYSNKFPPIMELVMTIEGNPKKYCSMLDSIGVLIDLNIIDEFLKE